MRTRMLTLCVFSLLCVGGMTHAADADEAKVAEYGKALKSKDATVRKQVAVALGEMGAKAKSAVPALRESLTDADAGVQSAAAAALEKISGADKAPAAEVDVKKLRAQLDEARAEAEKLKAALI